MSPLFTAGETKVSTSATFAPKSEVWNSPVGHGTVPGGVEWAARLVSPVALLGHKDEVKTGGANLSRQRDKETW